MRASVRPIRFLMAQFMAAVESVSASARLLPGIAFLTSALASVTSIISSPVRAVLTVTLSVANLAYCRRMVRLLRVCPSSGFLNDRLCVESYRLRFFGNLFSISKLFVRFAHYYFE